MTNRLPLAIIAILWALGMVALGCRPSAASQTGAITGRVTDSATGAAVANVRVSAVSPSATYRAATSANGFFAILGVTPDTYTLTFSVPGYSVTSVDGNTVNQDQTLTLAIKLAPAAKVLGHVTIRDYATSVQAKVTADQYVLNAQQANQTNGMSGAGLGSYSLYQTQGVVAALPGVSEDIYADPVIRGGKANEVGYEYDGIPITTPDSNGFGTNLVDDGVSRVVLSTGGYSASLGNAASGVINTVVGVGSYPPSGDLTFLAQSPDFYHGMVFNYGSATPDSRFSYFLGGVLWNSYYGYGDGKTFYPEEMSFIALGLQGVNPSRDQVANFHYRYGQENRNDVQVLLTTGLEHYNNYGTPFSGQTYSQFDAGTLCQPGSSSPCDFPNYPGERSASQLVNYNSHDDQMYWIDKVALTHSIGSLAFVKATVYRFGSYVANDAPYFADLGIGTGGYSDYDHSISNLYGAELEYQAQLNERHQLHLGAGYRTSKADDFSFQPTFAQITTSNTSGHEYHAYATDTWSPSDRWTFSLGLREDGQTVDRPHYDAVKMSQLSPRIGATYKTSENDVFRASYGAFIQFPGTSEQESDLQNFNGDGTSDFVFVGHPGGIRPEVTHQGDFSWEHQLGPALSFKISPFYKREGNVIESIPETVAASSTGGISPGNFVPENIGRSEANGVEFELQRQVDEGLSGFLTYTYVDAKSTTGSQFSDNAIGDPSALLAGHLFPQGFVAKHTVNLVLDYKHNGWEINPNAEYLSGYPYGNGTMLWRCDPNVTTACSPIQVPNDNCWNAGFNYYFLQNPGNVDGNGNCFATIQPGNPVIGTMGTTEGPDPNSLAGPGFTVVNLNVYRTIGRITVGVQIQNLLGYAKPTAYFANPYLYGPPGYAGNLTNYTPLPNGVPWNGITTDSGGNPVQSLPWTYGTDGYISESRANPREYLFTVAFKL